MDSSASQGAAAYSGVMDQAQLDAIIHAPDADAQWMTLNDSPAFVSDAWMCTARQRRGLDLACPGGCGDAGKAEGRPLMAACHDEVPPPAAGRRK